SLASDMAGRFPCAAPAPLDRLRLAHAESALGRPLPPVLRDAYLLVANGGFGPGYGLLPLWPTVTLHHVDLYHALSSTDPEDQAWRWPEELVPFCDWGCAIRSCVDTSPTRSCPDVRSRCVQPVPTYGQCLRNDPRKPPRLVRRLACRHQAV